jgi:glycosyltransferase involved in cell wall biosynthesis
MGAKDMGWDIIPLFEREMKLKDADPTNRLVLTSQDINYISAPPDDLLNLIYNACDVGINTSNGEGWGLVSFEHASCRKPQVVPNHTSCQDIWKDAGLLIDISTWIVDKDLGVGRGLIDVDHAEKLLTQLYEDPALYAKVAEDCYNVTQKPEYRWESVAAGFSQAVTELVN